MMDTRAPHQQLSNAQISAALFELSHELTASGQEEEGALVFIAANRLKQIVRDEKRLVDDGK